MGKLHMTYNAELGLAGLKAFQKFSNRLKLLDLALMQCGIYSWDCVLDHLLKLLQQFPTLEMLGFGGNFAGGSQTSEKLDLLRLQRNSLQALSLRACQLKGLCGGEKIGRLVAAISC